MPLLYAKKEVFQWLKEGKKTIDIRKGSPHSGETVIFQSGPLTLKRRVVKTEVGLLQEVLREDNYWLVIPSAVKLGDALDYFRGLYGGCEGLFTAYYVES
jgi:ASC-1-like (ASCH) protein